MHFLSLIIKEHGWRFCGFFHGAIPRAAVFTLSFGRKEKGRERLALRQHGGLLSKVAGYFS